MKGVFYNLHPITCFIYFAFMLSFTMLFTHPVCISISFISAALYALYLCGAKAFFKKLLYILPFMIFTAILNPLFNHRGTTILHYFPNGNPLTLESLFYGAFAAFMMGAVIMWLMCFTIVMDSDKIICLFGNIMPSLSLVITITLRFIPMYLQRMKDAWNIRRCTFEKSDGNIVKIKIAFSVLSSVTSWALESGVETANSMRSRGHGSGRRTSYSIYRFELRDALYLAVFFVLGISFIIFALFGYVNWQYYPKMTGSFSEYSIFAFVALTALGFIPFVSEIAEDIKWNLLKSKI